jgi:dTDP-4-amino-4,6-dideoxygalactose transaminase|tara:strand:+ start:1232 stop:2524 length:1293 start_codon:yes stop_codon:yes gene_type:complete
MHNKNKLAIHGGSKLILKKFKKFNTYNHKELDAATKVINSGNLSEYIAASGKYFHGGKFVRAFERKIEKYFGVKRAILVNSWTSGLIAAVGALDIEPGDEIITAPWTMCASATAILHWNCIPVFADVEPDTFCIDPASVESLITKKTKAILSIDIAGQSADMKSLKKIAKKYKLKIISDSAQAPGSLYQEKYTGTLSDIGGFSLNYHKHIHTGEGGILVTNDLKLAERMCLIRNHAEAAISNKQKLNNMVGHNFRMGEIEAAMGIEQLRKLKSIVKNRQAIAFKIGSELKKLPGLEIPKVRKDCTHVYYMYQMKIDQKKIGVSRDFIHKALVAEGINCLHTKFANLHLLPMYQKKIAYGSRGFPWVFNGLKSKVSYKKGICPVAEGLHSNSYLGFELCQFEMSKQETDLFINAFKKIWANLEEIKKFLNS